MRSYKPIWPTTRVTRGYSVLPSRAVKRLIYYILCLISEMKWFYFTWQCVGIIYCADMAAYARVAKECALFCVLIYVCVFCGEYFSCNNVLKG